MILCDIYLKDEYKRENKLKIQKSQKKRKVFLKLIGVTLGRKSTGHLYSICLGGSKVKKLDLKLDEKLIKC